MMQLPKTADPLVIRADFERDQAWKAICDLIRAPNSESGLTLYASVEFLEDSAYRGLEMEELVAALPEGYAHTFFFVVDGATTASPEFPIMVVDLYETRGRSFRAVPSQLQGIQNNLSIANMGFKEFADAVGADGVFRGFPKG